MDQSFAGWLWQGLRNMGSLSGESRSEKEIKIGRFLLLSQVAWLAVPVSPVRVIIHFGQLLLGLVLMLHGDYLKSGELAEEKRRLERQWKRQDRETYRQLKEMTIKQIAEVNEISLEEATKKADEMVWYDSKGNATSPPWLRETEEEK